MATPADILAPGPFAEVRVTWDAAVPEIPPAAAAHIEARWSTYASEARARGRDLFNAPVVALRGYAVGAGRLALALGPSDYKTFLVTCLRDHAWFAANAPGAVTPALGNSALLTWGETAFFGVRSARVSAYAGRAHVFGGVVEVAQTAAGLLAHLYKELAEELGLARADLAREPRLLALVRDPALRQPELVWHCELCRPPETVHPHEHDRLEAVPRGNRGATPLTPVAEAAMGLWETSR